MRPYSLIIALALIASSAQAGLIRHSAKNPEQVVPVLATHPQALSASPSTVAIGMLQAPEDVWITSKINGYINSIHFQEGDHVNAGQTLITLDNTQIKAALASSQAAYDAAQKNKTRTEKLAQHGYASKEALDNAESALANAKATLALNQQNLDDSILKAPFSGTLGAAHLNAGDYVAAATQLVELVNRKHLRVIYHLPERDLGKITLGQTVSVNAKAFPKLDFKAVTHFISPTVNTDTGTFEVHADLDNADNKLAPGEYVTVTQDLGNKKETLTVPETAVLASAEGYYVFVINDGKLSKQIVTIGQHHRNNVVIKTGLNAKDLIVSEGGDNLISGQHVKVATP